MNDQFWNLLKVIGPVGIFVILALIVILRYGPGFVKNIRNDHNGRIIRAKTSGEESTESWVIRIEEITRKTLVEFFRDRDADIQQVFSKELDIFFTRLKDHIAIVEKQRELDKKTEELEELRRTQRFIRPSSES